MKQSTARYEVDRQRIDALLQSDISSSTLSLPSELVRALQEWKWGVYGWTSPTNLLITAAWMKWLHPRQDCCKIWADDEKGLPIQGGYSIRSADEEVTVPLFSKHDLTQNFCSANSGMQGSRAIEKMRSKGRIQVDEPLPQKTVFSWSLFSKILNLTDRLSDEQALELVKWYIVKAREIRQSRILAQKSLLTVSTTGFDPLATLATIHDPELTKCVVAACLDIIYGSFCQLSGVEDAKTAADARAVKPGDLCLTKNALPIVAIEVKDKTQTIDWQNITRAKTIIDRFSSLRLFLFVLENRQAAASERIGEMVSSPQIVSSRGDLISIISVHDLFGFASTFSSMDTIASKINYFLSLATSLKCDTRNIWRSAQQ